MKILFSRRVSSVSELDQTPQNPKSQEFINGGLNMKDLWLDMLDFKNNKTQRIHLNKGLEDQKQVKSDILDILKSKAAQLNDFIFYRTEKYQFA